jgi:hypothetical protein
MVTEVAVDDWVARAWAEEDIPATGPSASILSCCGSNDNTPTTSPLLGTANLAKPVSENEINPSALGSPQINVGSNHASAQQQPNNTLPPCEACGMTFGRPQELRRHRDTIHSDGKRECPLCPPGSWLLGNRVDNSRRHFRNVHSLNGEDAAKYAKGLEL